MESLEHPLMVNNIENIRSQSMQAARNSLKNISNQLSETGIIDEAKNTINAIRWIPLILNKILKNWLCLLRRHCDQFWVLQFLRIQSVTRIKMHWKFSLNSHQIFITYMLILDSDILISSPGFRIFGSFLFLFGIFGSLEIYRTLPISKGIFELRSCVQKKAKNQWVKIY